MENPMENPINISIEIDDIRVPPLKGNLYFDPLIAVGCCWCVCVWIASMKRNRFMILPMAD